MTLLCGQKRLSSFKTRDMYLLVTHKYVRNTVYLHYIMFEMSLTIDLKLQPELQV